MSKHDITQIPIKSAVKIFTFLDQFLEEENLDPKYFEDCMKNFTSEEQYFIFVYASKYFDYKEGNFIHKWAENIVYSYGFDEVKDYLSMILTNAEKLLKKVNTESTRFKEIDYLNAAATKTKESDFITHLATSQPLKQKITLKLKKGENINDFKVHSRIPLYIDKTVRLSFRNDMHNILKGILDYELIDKLFYNAFEFPANIYELQFLHLNVGRKSDLESCVNILYKTYKDKILQHRTYDSYITKYNKKVDTTPKRTGYYSYLNPKKIAPPKILRYHFMIALYNAFPYIRESVSESIEKDSTKTIESCLTQKIKNL
ncbi:hypothetical protein [Chryseobacterium sp.]|uniref:hypothetical protein n=1 Tax=Chryseobacterium sp. TaxID=1871047 RepID=UPI0035B0F4BF